MIFRSAATGTNRPDISRLGPHGSSLACHGRPPPVGGGRWCGVAAETSALAHNRLPRPQSRYCALLHTHADEKASVFLRGHQRADDRSEPSPSNVLFSLLSPTLLFLLTFAQRPPLKKKENYENCKSEATEHADQTRCLSCLLLGFFFQHLQLFLMFMSYMSFFA